MRVRLAVAAVLSALGGVLTGWLLVVPFAAQQAVTAQALRRSGVVEVTPWGLLALSFVVTAALGALVLHLTLGLRLARLTDVALQVGRASGLPESDADVLRQVEAQLKWLGASLAEERQRGAARHTEFVRLQAELDRIKTELVSQDRLATAGKLAAGVAHEVGNPLAGILGYLTLLRIAKTPQDLQDTIVRIEAEVQRIDEIVRALLELGRPSRGKAEPTDVVPLVNAAVGLLRSSEELKGVGVTVSGPSSAYARAEPGPLSQVLVNLLLNAGQATEGKGQVRVDVVADDRHVRVDVTDDGPGIPAHVLPRLFELFFTTKPAGKGTGLGLAVSRHLLSQFGAQISAANAPAGRGAVFSITLPLP